VVRIPPITLRHDLPYAPPVTPSRPPTSPIMPVTPPPTLSTLPSPRSPSMAELLPPRNVIGSADAAIVTPPPARGHPRWRQRQPDPRSHGPISTVSRLLWEGSRAVPPGEVSTRRPASIPLNADESPEAASNDISAGPTHFPRLSQSLYEFAPMVGGYFALGGDCGFLGERNWNFTTVSNY